VIKTSKGKTRNFVIQLAKVVVLFSTAVATMSKTHQLIRPVVGFFNWVLTTVGLRATQLLIAFIIVGIGVGAYNFKRKNQKWYGTLEVLVGFFSAVFVAGSMAPHTIDLAKWATLAGSAYVVARGLENRMKGIEALTGKSTNPVQAPSGSLQSSVKV